MKQQIDLDRGVVIKRHSSGMYVYMYVDNPGVYLDPFGREVSESLAKLAGYPVEKYAKERLRRDKMAAAMSAIEVELELANSAEEEDVIARKGEFRVVALGLGNAHVMDEDGERLTPMPIAREQALALLDHLAGETEEKAKEKK